ncbi:cytidine monophosphate-N-acetylneuraminic acid hydroxylase-like [Hydractinia symbiolongicarpus]|uniref:cytidine monophosphate-N-acetylneuraminic acid hydroxylase-like n=1 Tax=Hydractinia symbiolongicarpus TaxID=13093 RepID=UPI00254A95A6|nr:cytidine monophosphate-N-acetylneuraminic acid hydroxylase-like [Hydractinia symbiolongicarpus]
MGNGRKMEIFQQEDWYKVYFEWANLRNCNCVVKVTGFDTKTGDRDVELLIDFNNITFPKSRPKHKHSFIEFSICTKSLRHLIIHGISWQEVYKNYQRKEENMDAVEKRFWKHFCSSLPKKAPKWENNEDSKATSKAENTKSMDDLIIRIRQVLVPFLTIGTVLAGCWVRYTLKYYRTET